MSTIVFLRQLKAITKISFLITFLANTYSFAEGEILDTKSILACEYTWNFPTRSSNKLTGLLIQDKTRVTVPIVEDEMSLVEKLSPFSENNIFKVFSDLPKCKSNLNCGAKNIFMMSANLHKKGTDKSLNVNLCIFGLCSTAVDRSEPFDVELRIEEHGSILISEFMPNLFVLKCSVESQN